MKREMGCGTRFSYNKYWEHGRLQTREECEDWSCHPYPWMGDEESCAQHSYCEGSCPRCAPADGAAARDAGTGTPRNPPQSVTDGGRKRDETCGVRRS